MTRRALLGILPLSIALETQAQQQKANLRPPKKDLPYLLEATKLIPTEVEQATESGTKQARSFSVPGTTSPARTPLPEPIFLFSPGNTSPEQLELFRFEVKDGRRQVTPGKHTEGDDQSELRLTVRKLDPDLYRIEAAEMLDPGEYSLSPQGANTAFCFTVY